ncbi:hypothetical protein TNCV_4677321 [Trichonephila clavipes]|nr:hypothetical protein TNCV_4677321 [Trichonephila clavipes]
MTTNSPGIVANMVTNMTAKMVTKMMPTWLYHQHFLCIAIVISVGWLAWLVCRWPSEPKAAGSTPAQVDEFS